MKNTADEILELIKNMENGERWKLLDIMYDEYYNTRKNSTSKVEDKISNLEKDIDYLSRKVGKHEMYLNRLLKEDEK